MFKSLFRAIVAVHRDQLHAAAGTTHTSFKEQYFTATKEEVDWVLQRCTLCALKTKSLTKAPLNPIKSSCCMERIQIDLIDMRALNEEMKWILHIQDHFSKFSLAYPLTAKMAGNVATKMAEWFGLFGFPRIIQCDNGTEFKGECEELFLQHGILIINGSPR